MLSKKQILKRNLLALMSRNKLLGLEVNVSWKLIGQIRRDIKCCAKSFVKPNPAGTKLAQRAKDKTLTMKSW